MKEKGFDIVDIILDKFAYHPYGKACRQAYDDLQNAITELENQLNYVQKKKLDAIEEKQDIAIIEHEKEFAYFMMDCLRSIFTEFK